MTDKHITWIDRGREPTEKPDPRYPDGVDVDVTAGANGEKTCKVDLPYPAKRCGLYVIVCKTCDWVTAVTTAGRPDDPRSVTIPCKVTMR